MMHTVHKLQDQSSVSSQLSDQQQLIILLINS